VRDYTARSPGSGLAVRKRLRSQAPLLPLTAPQKLPSHFFDSEKLELLRLHSTERGFFLLRFRGILLGLAILVLVSGLLLFAITTVRETHTSSRSSSSNGPLPGGTFSYGATTLTPNTAPGVTEESIIGTTGTADLMILASNEFNSWVCNQLSGAGSLGEPTSDCIRFGGPNIVNITILESYLQTHQSQIVYSQTIADQNITLSSLAYHVTTPTNVTIVIAELGTSKTTRDYFQTTITNQTTSYPLIGYTEQSGTFWSLPNLSLGVMATGAALLAIGLVWPRIQVPHPSTRSSAPNHGRTTLKCPGCGGENLFFAERCRQCGRILHETPPMMEAR